MVKGAADHGILAGLQHDVAANKLLDRSLAVRQQAAQGQLATAPEGGPEHHDAQVQQVTVGRVRAPDEPGGQSLGDWGREIIIKKITTTFPAINLNLSLKKQKACLATHDTCNFYVPLRFVNPPEFFAS